MSNEQRQYLYRSLQSMEIAFEESFTNFILVHVGGDSSQVAGALLKKGVIIRDMAAWGLKGYIRVSIGSASENKRFIKTLGEIAMIVILRPDATEANIQHIVERAGKLGLQGQYFARGGAYGDRLYRA